MFVGFWSVELTVLAPLKVQSQAVIFVPVDASVKNIQSSIQILVFCGVKLATGPTGSGSGVALPNKRILSTANEGSVPIPLLSFLHLKANLKSACSFNIAGSVIDASCHCP